MELHRLRMPDTSNARVYDLTLSIDDFLSLTPIPLPQYPGFPPLPFFDRIRCFSVGRSRFGGSSASSSDGA